MTFNDIKIIFKNDSCSNCNTCTSVCPVMNTHLSLQSINHTMCIHCGNCISACDRNVKNYLDDTQQFFEMLENGEQVSVIVSPDFYAKFGDKASNILGYLRKKGVYKIYDAGTGAMISLWATIKYLSDNLDNPDKAFLSQNCSALINLLERYYPEFIKYIIPVYSPMVCAGIYTNHYLNDKSALAFLSSCISKKDEINILGNSDIKALNVTFNRLSEYIDEDISDYYSESDLTGNGFGNLFPFAGTFKDAVSIFFPKYESVYSYDSIDNDTISMLKDVLSDKDKESPLFIELTNCTSGCVAGPGNCPEHKSLDFNSLFAAVSDNSPTQFSTSEIPEANFHKLYKMFEHINYNDFIRSFEYRLHEQFEIPRSTSEDIFIAMHKNTPEKRTINCGACGCKSCNDMVVAIAHGFNKMENCIHYMQDEFHIRFHTDLLTNIPNAEGFYIYAAEKIAANPDATYAIAVAGINELNVINELYGFKVGDLIIKKLANMYSSFAGRHKGVAGRLAGGEFLLCFEYSDEIIKSIHKIASFDCKEFGVAFPATARIGIYIDEDHSKSINSMVSLAQLTKDKLDETSTYSYLIFDEEINKKIALEAFVTAQMYSALANKEFVPYFQPQYNHKTHKMVGAEVLCRWFQDDDKMVSPGIFIPIFEKSGFVKQLDKYMWEKAFETIRHWIDSNKPYVPISVNISRVSIIEEDFVETIANIQKKYQIPTDSIHFEITESAYARKPHIIIDRINKIREMGFKIAMDDFGSGYSSLNTLKDVPIDILKLDMGFLRGDNVDKGESIIRHVVSMARELGLSIVTEGVEKLEQADFLKHVGCSIVQGFYYARPMPINHFEELCYTSI